MPWTLLERFQKYNWDTTEANKDTIFSARFGREQHTWRVLAQTAEAYFDEQCGRHGQPIHFDRWRPGESIRYKSYWSLFADKVASTTFGGESVAKHRDRDICLEWSMTINGCNVEDPQKIKESCDLTHVAFSDVVCRWRLRIEGISTFPSGYSKLRCCLHSRDAENVWESQL